MSATVDSDGIAWCPAGHMIEVEGGEGDWCAACDREDDEFRPPPGWLNAPRRWLEQSPLTLHDGPLPQAGSWPLGVPRSIAEQEQAARRATARLRAAKQARRYPDTPEAAAGL